MVKVREFCCGCSLRSGTFTIAWGTLVYSGIVFLFTVYQFLYFQRRANDYKTLSSSWYTFTPPSPFIFAYNVSRAVAGLAVSVTALWALHKNEIKFLNGLFWYLCYMVGANILDDLLLILEPTWEKALGETNPYLMNYSYDYIENILTLLIIYFFMAGFASYFALIVKSYRDYSLRNAAQHVQFMGPDPITVGYVAA